MGSPGTGEEDETSLAGLAGGLCDSDDPGGLPEGSSGP